MIFDGVYRLDVSGFWRLGVWAKGILGAMSVLASLDGEGRWVSDGRRFLGHEKASVVC